MTLPSIRLPLICLLAMLAVLVVAAPAAEAKGKTRGAVCTASAGALRPTPLRTCVRTRKAPRALPSSRRTDTASRAKRRRAAESRVVAMMG